MARNLARRGHEVCGYDVAPGAVEAAGVRPCGGLPRCFNADYVVLTLPTGREVLGVLSEAADLSGTILIDTTTEGLDEVEAILRAVGERRGRYLTWRVERGPKDAEEGRLVLYVGGDEALYRRALDLLAQLGEPIYVGSHREATILKLVSTALLTATTALLSEAAEVLRRAGVDAAKALEALSRGGASSAQLSARLPSMLAGNYPEGFSVQAAEAVLGQYLRLAESLGVSASPLLRRSHEILREAAAAGLGARDIAELAEYARLINKP